MNDKTLLTNEFCKKLLRSRETAVLIATFVFFAIVGLLAYFMYDNSSGFLWMAILLLLISVVRILYSNYRLSKSYIYFETDTVADVKISRRIKYIGAEKIYTFDFGSNGIFKVTKSEALFSFTIRQNEFGRASDDALDHFDVAQEFHLMIAEYKGKKEILQIFSSSSYELDTGAYVIQ